jgi:hypothetical protein
MTFQRIAEAELDTEARSCKFYDYQRRKSVKLSIRILIFCLLFTLIEGVAYSQNVQPSENPSVTVIGKVPPTNHDHYTYFQPDPLLLGTISGHHYHNDFFGFSYDIPQGFAVEDADVTKRRDKGDTVRAEPPGSPLTAQTVKVMVPVTLLNATPIGTENRARLAIPYVSIAVGLSVSSQLSVESIRQTLESGESGRQAHGIHLLSGPVEVTISGRPFFRTDFNESSDGASIWKTFFRTSIHGGELDVDFCASSEAELDQLAATVESLAFDQSSQSSSRPTAKP